MSKINDIQLEINTDQKLQLTSHKHKPFTNEFDENMSETNFIDSQNFPCNLHFLNDSKFENQNQWEEPYEFLENIIQDQEKWDVVIEKNLLYPDAKSKI